MKYAAMVAVLLSVCACSAFAGDGQISKSGLAEMGLSNMQVMSDVQGLEIRGKFAQAWGNAYANTFFSSADGHYNAIGVFFGAGAAGAIASGPFITTWAASGSIAVAF